MWRSLVSRLVWDQDAAGSSPVIPTTSAVSKLRAAVFLCLRLSARVETSTGSVSPQKSYGCCVNADYGFVVLTACNKIVCILDFPGIK